MNVYINLLAFSILNAKELLDHFYLSLPRHVNYIKMYFNAFLL